MPKPINVERGLELSVLMTVLGAALLFLGISDALDWVVDLKGWGFYTGGGGVLLLIAGVAWMITIVQRMKRFDILMQERSKAVFVRSLDDIEYTAWRLPTRYDELLAQKKKEMGVK
jgi:hypothetical protein